MAGVPESSARLACDFVIAGTSSHSPSDTLDSLVDDDICKHLRRCFFPGRGRPPALPEVQLTNRLLLQLKLLQAEGKKSSKDVSKWFDMLFPDVSYPSTRLSGALDRLEKKVQAVQREDGDIDSFLKTEVDFDFVSSSLSKVGLKRGQLLTEREWTRPDHLETLTHENVINIEQFRTKERQPDTFTCQWIKKLSPKHEASPDSLLKKSTKKLMETYRSLQLQKNAHQSQALSLFLIMPFDTVDKHTPLRSTSSSCCSETVPSTSSVTPQQKEIKQLSKANSVLQVNIKDLSEKVSVLKGALVDVSREKSRVTTDLDRATQQNADLQATIDVLQVKLEESQRKVHQMNPMHLNKLEKRLKTARADLRSAVTRQTVAERKLEKEKNTLQRTRVQTSKLKAAVIKTEWQNEELKQEVQELRQIVSATTVEGLKAELRAGEKNRYSDSVRKTVMALQADANVAASQCGKVISIVGQHLFNVDLKEEDLPKLQTSINIADEGHFLAKFQATETILAADNVTLHTDGTSRGAHKIVGQQITLDSGATLYLGLNTVATEDSETLLEVTIQMLQELSDVYAAEETNDRKEEVFNALLTKLTSCMSDRAAVMKLFSTKLSDFFQSTLGQEVTLHFLKCNAHFLLGLSRSCETSLKTLEEEMTEQLGRKLGRDTHQKFQRFRGNERATARVIRLASSLLGPRGDEKNGCRAEWLAFLKNKSLLTSYRSNRFNCFFLSAAAVVHHQHDMKNFLHGGLLGHSNLKIESLAEDLKDDHLLALVCAVALLYFAITGPFWQLLESNTKYFELHTYIQQLERSVEHWRGDASELLDPGFPGVFGGEFCIVSDMKAAVYKFVSEHTNTVKHALEVLMRDLLVVMRLQLVDFLSGGKYGQAQPPEVMEKLKHCPITNLLGENVFGEMDFNMNKAHNASFHHHTSTLMLKHNKTSKWLQEKSSRDANDILRLARKKSKSLRNEHKRQELIVKHKIKEKMLENERERKRKEMKVAQQRASIIQRVRDHGGPCCFDSDVTTLVQQLQDDGASCAKIVRCLQDEVRYQKQVLGVGKTLKITKTNGELQQALKAHLGPEQQTDHDSSSEDDLEPPLPKRQRTMEPTPEFTRQGEWVAVFYDQGFFIGQVTLVENPGTAHVSFLENTKSCRDYFRWPRVEDVANVDSQYVFRWDVEVLPVSNDGRIWQVSDLQDIADAYKRLLQ
ncbi:hypothetical protein ACOMHN_005594 [Nucella lapillus]